VKYNWAKSLYQVMVGNFWVPEKVKGLSEDANQFNKELSDEERRAYK
jgi:ribonucleoside-diphosphate reductase beta chain